MKHDVLNYLHGTLIQPLNNLNVQWSCSDYMHRRPAMSEALPRCKFVANRIRGNVGTVYRLGFGIKFSSSKI